MPIPIINSIASWFLKKRIHQMELFMKYPAEVQQELLMSLIDKAQTTVIGKKYDFKSIENYRQFAERLPKCRYEDIEDTIERTRRGENNLFWSETVRFFAKSSGTTNSKSKFIPVSQDSLEDCHYAASKDLLCLYLNNNPDAQLFTGKSLRLGGSKELYKQNKTVFGDLSAILIDNMPFWASFSSTPNNEITLMSDFEKKMDAIANYTTRENVTSLAGVPSWMLVLLNHIIEKTGKNHLLEIWPNLEVYFHGGVSFHPYTNQYENLIPKKDFRYYEIYNASEGFFAVQDLNNSDELLLMLDYGIFYEFIPMDTFQTPSEKILPLWEVKKGVNYAMVITTNAGLWRYQIGDTVRFSSINPYRIKVTGRTKHHINAFGEELIIENAEEALKRVSKLTDCEIVDYTAAPVFMKDKQKGGHEWIVEFKTPPENLKFFQKSLDETLQNLNSDYEAKRYKNSTLSQLKIHSAKPKLFYHWSKKHQKLGGQHKIPRLSNKREYLEELLEINRQL